MDPLKCIEFMDKYSFSLSIFTALVGFSIGKLVPILRQNKIKKCLSLGKHECKIILPDYMGKLHNQKDILALCPIGDIKAASNVIDLIHSTGLYSHQQSIIFEESYADSFENYNIFCIGGSLANHYTYDLFQQFFKNFKICASEEKIKTNPNKIPASNFAISSQDGFCWGDSDNEKFLVNKGERYAVIVKLSSRDFNIENHGTVHILFGNGIEGTIAISKYLLNNYLDLYKKVRGKSHYFLAFKIKRDTGIIIPNSFTDLTNKMFL